MRAAKEQSSSGAPWPSVVRSGAGAVPRGMAITSSEPVAKSGRARTEPGSTTAAVALGTPTQGRKELR
jgi:hypothetical protein